MVGSAKPNARTTPCAILRRVFSLRSRSACLGSIRLVLRTTLISSARIVEIAPNPVSPGASSMCVGAFAGVVLSGTTRTVLALSCRLRASVETITTGRLPFSGGSLGNCTNQISPRRGCREGGKVYVSELADSDSANLPQASLSSCSSEASES